MKRIWKDYGLSLTLAALFLVSWIGQFITQAIELGNNAAAHGQEFQWSEFWAAFGQATFENWQSEFLQLLTFVVLTSFLVHRGSHESKDSDEEMKGQLDRIERLLGGRT